MDLSAYLSDNNAIAATNRAAAAWKRINDKPSSVTFKNRADTVLDAQTVRIEYDNRASETDSAAGRGPLRKLTIFGVKDHDTVTDTDIGEGYRFIYDGDEYRVIDVIASIGEVQASCEAIG